MRKECWIGKVPGQSPFGEFAPNKGETERFDILDIVPFSCSSYEHSYLTVVTELSTHISLPMLWEFVANENVFGYHAKK